MNNVHQVEIVEIVICLKMRNMLTCLNCLQEAWTLLPRLEELEEPAKVGGGQFISTDREQYISDACF